MWEALLASVLGVLATIWPALLGGALAVLAVYAAKRWFVSEDNKYKKYIPYVIQAIRLAEKYIPDKGEGAEDTALTKADEALKNFIEIYTEAEGMEPSEALLNWVKRVKELVLLDLQNKKTFANPDAE